MDNTENMLNMNTENTADDVKTALEIMHMQMERFLLKTLMEHVNEYLVGYCMENPDFAEQINHPERSIIQCMEFIKERAKEWLKDEQKMELFQYGAGLGGAIPRDIVFGWAVEYYYSKPKPMQASYKKPDKADNKDNKSKNSKKGKPAEDNKINHEGDGQIDLFGNIGTETNAETENNPTSFEEISEDITDSEEGEDNPFDKEAVA